MWYEEPQPSWFRFVSISSAAAEKNIKLFIFIHIRACRHVGGGPQVGEGPQLVEVTRLAVIVRIYTYGGVWEIESTKKRKYVSVIGLPGLIS